MYRDSSKIGLVIHIVWGNSPTRLSPLTYTDTENRECIRHILLYENISHGYACDVYLRFIVPLVQFSRTFSGDPGKTLHVSRDGIRNASPWSFPKVLLGVLFDDILPPSSFPSDPTIR